MDTGEPFFNGDNTGLVYGLGFYFFTLLLIFILCYICHICKSRLHSPPPPTTDADHDYISITQGLRDDILATFPTFLYSEIVMPAQGDTQKDHVRHINSYNSGCSICLADYKPTDVLRLLPECGHLFHLSCIDTWMKVHPTCPMCRNSVV